MQKADGRSFSHDYTHLLPNLSLEYDFPRGGQSLSLEFSESITRPWLRDLNPYKNWSAVNAYSQGNPDLKPCTSSYVSLDYTFLHDFSVGADYRYDNSNLFPYTLNDAEGNVVTSLTNAGRWNAVSFYTSYSKQINNSLYLRASLSASYDNCRAIVNGQNVGFNMWSGSMRLYCMCVLSRRYSITGNIYGGVTTPGIEQYNHAPWKRSLGLDITKNFPFGAMVSLSLSNLLWYKAESHKDTGEFAFRNRDLTCPLGVNLTFVYVFGKTTARAASDESHTSMSDR